MEHLNKLVKHDLVIGLSNIKFVKDKLCDACQKRKKTKPTTSTVSHGIVWSIKKQKP